jgi:hypothetical protein
MCRIYLEKTGSYINYDHESVIKTLGTSVITSKRN